MDQPLRQPLVKRQVNSYLPLGGGKKKDDQKRLHVHDMDGKRRDTIPFLFLWEKREKGGLNYPPTRSGKKTGEGHLLGKKRATVKYRRGLAETVPLSCCLAKKKGKKKRKTLSAPPAAGTKGLPPQKKKGRPYRAAYPTLETFGWVGGGGFGGGGVLGGFFLVGGGFFFLGGGGWG